MLPTFLLGQKLRKIGEDDGDGPSNPGGHCKNSALENGHILDPLPAPVLWIPKSLSSSGPFKETLSHMCPISSLTTSHQALILGKLGNRQAGLGEWEGTNIES